MEPSQNEYYILTNGLVTNPLELKDGVYRDGGTFTWDIHGKCREAFTDEFDIRWAYVGSMRQIIDIHLTYAYA